jgi:uncharacterized membrane protein
MNRLPIALIATGFALASLGSALCCIAWFVPLIDRWDDTRLTWGLGLTVAGVVIGLLGVSGRHRALIRSRSTPRTFLTESEEQRILLAIREFESKTSCEIRIHLQAHAQADILADAKLDFTRLGMARTDRRNGVLIFVATTDRRVAILGDQAIDACLGPEGWDQIVALTTRQFTNGAMAEGLIQALQAIRDRLTPHFPPQPDDRNELPNAISRE